MDYRPNTPVRWMEKYSREEKTVEQEEEKWRSREKMDEEWHTFLCEKRNTYKKRREKREDAEQDDDQEDKRRRKKEKEDEA